MFGFWILHCKGFWMLLKRCGVRLRFLSAFWIAMCGGVLDCCGSVVGVPVVLLLCF